MFYCFNQNNSGGSFVVNDRLCHRLFIEADSMEEAIDKAADLGCYWDGVNKGIDCPCCGDRWYGWPDSVELDKIANYDVSALTFAEWRKKYGRYEIVKQPYCQKGYSVQIVCGTISFRSIEEYAQFLADEYGWTTPDIRIFYKNGTVTEIFSDRVREKKGE